MREQAGAIRRELHLLFEDVRRLGERVEKLDTHFTQAQNDVREIRISSDKTQRRARKLDNFDFEELAPDTQPDTPADLPAPHLK
jgi:DNA recombination protein RmuC